MVGDVKATLTALEPMIEEKHDDKFLRTHVEKTEHFNKKLQHYVTKGPGIKPIRPEYVAAVLDELADDDAMFFADTGTPCIWAARHIHYGPKRRLFGSFTWASMASASPNAFGAQLAFPGRQTHRLVRRRGLHNARHGRPSDRSPAQEPRRPRHLQQRMLDFVNIEQQEAGFIPFGTDFVNPDFAKVAEACGARGIRIEEPGRRSGRSAIGSRTQRRTGRRRRTRRPLGAVAARPRARRDAEGLHAQPGQTSAPRQDGRHHRDGRAQYPAALNVQAPLGRQRG